MTKLLLFSNCYFIFKLLHDIWVLELWLFYWYKGLKNGAGNVSYTILFYKLLLLFLKNFNLTKTYQNNIKTSLQANLAAI